MLWRLEPIGPPQPAPPPIQQIEQIGRQDADGVLNYGVDRVRFPAPVPVGSRIRGAAELVKVEEIKGSIHATIRVSVEIEGQERPACVADTISRYYF